MTKRIIILAVLLATAVLLAACAAEEEGEDTDTTPLPATATAQATVNPQAAGTAQPTASLPPTATEAPTPGATEPTATPGAETATPTGTPTVPGEWQTYTHSGGLFTVRYPPNWFQRQDAFYSSDPDLWNAPEQPAEVTVVAVGYYEAAGSSACVALDVDPKSGEGSPVEGATPPTLGGPPAWP